MIIPVRADNGGYDIILEKGALCRAGEWLNLNRKVLILTDDGVPEQYVNLIAEQAKEPVIFRTAQGEASKCVAVWEQILTTMLEAGFTRGDCLTAVGGGVMGDLGGFAAACYMRGIDFYNVPTTLLSQVDSSVGGKTAVDFCGMKNIVGSFYPPKRVLIDPDVLRTLDPRQYAAGMAEVIKMAAAFDAELFEMLESNDIAGDRLTDVIHGALNIKKKVVEEDPLERGIRKALNFGHTVGHAIESMEEGRLLHGECVALGMIPMSNGEARERIISILKRFNLPIRYEKAGDALVQLLRHDKKACGKDITAVMVEQIGSFCFQQMTAEELSKASEVLK